MTEPTQSDPTASRFHRRPRIGVAALARPTFDVTLAEETAANAFSALDRLEVDLVGGRSLLMDGEQAEHALAELAGADLDALLVLQVTFTDAAMTGLMAERLSVPAILWSFREPRTGGRLRLNSLCGTNLAAHKLGRAGSPFTFVHGNPDDDGVMDRLLQAIAVCQTASRLSHARIAVIGDHPPGFETCRYDRAAIKSTFGATVEPLGLDALFDAADQTSAETLAGHRQRIEATLTGLNTVDARETDGTLKLFEGLNRLAETGRYDGFAVRCWPEMFTERSCAACGAMALSGQDGRPAGCEADVMGTLTSLTLQWIAGDHAFMADLVDVDAADDTAVFWHCGLAPVAMADPSEPPGATVHSNRRKPLLNEFALKPGRITVARLTQARNQPALVLAGAEILEAPRSFSGTSGVARFDQPADRVLDQIMQRGLEHHYSLVYGDHRPALRQLAGLIGLPVIELA